MALPEIRSSEGLSLFIISRFHGAAAASLLVPADLGAEIICDVVWFLNALRPFHAQRRTRRRPVELPHGTFHGPISNLGVQLSSASQRRSIAAARSCMFRPRKEKWGLPCACEIGQGPPLGCFPRGDAGVAAGLSSAWGPRLRSTPGFRIFNHRLLDGHWPRSGMARHLPWKCAEQPGEVLPSLDGPDGPGLDYRGTWGTIDGEHAGNGS